eukprot:8114320-Pyramimonas_sp.AAC.1
MLACSERDWPAKVAKDGPDGPGCKGTEGRLGRPKKEPELALTRITPDDVGLRTPELSGVARVR